ncbi:MAG TPA: trehalose-6-phosphate synthase [Acidimicrobiales bacterium]|nr:trehalose-6-phosphate synthase [Acidimicrobiales bacterium]
MQAQSKLLVISNRGPISYVREPGGGVRAKRGAGGLVVTLGPGAQRDGALWLAAATSAEDREGAASGAVSTDGFSFQPVVIEPADYGAYYDVIANQTLWFCLHGLWDRPRRPRFDRHWWEAWSRYCAVNEAFAAAADAAAEEGATVLVQDYQLCLVPAALARRRPDLRISTFLHTPWCAPQELATLPDEVGRDVLGGLTGGGPVGFHTARWAQAFRDCTLAVLGDEADTYVAPAATDTDDLLAVSRSEACAAALRELDETIGDRKVIVRVDRIEPSKNVLRGFWAFDELLEQRPDLRGRVVFAAMVYPSRVGLSEYQAYGQEALALAASLNDKWGTADWTPVILDPADDYPRSVAALRRFDVLLVNPVRDGLNLVAKEGPLVNERDGVLILSREAGAWAELGDAAIGINPFDISATASAMARALDMDPAERADVSARVRSAATARTPLDWFDDLVASAGGRGGD